MRVAEQTSADRIADRLKERVYVTFSSLAVVVTMSSHTEGISVGSAAFTLAITVAATVLAVFVADIAAHMVAHAGLPSRDELGHMAKTSFGALGAIILPMLYLLLAAFELWQLNTALRAATVTLAATLIAVGYIAIRRVRLPLWQRLVVLLAVAALGFAVIALELLAHG